MPSTTIQDLPLGPDVTVLESNADGLIALNKPDGVLSHPNAKDSSKDQSRALLTASYDDAAECYQWTDDAGQSHAAWLINRLDSPTSGVILMALDPDLAEVLKQQFSTHRVTKVYYAVVRCDRKPGGGEWKDVLSKEVYTASRIKKRQSIPAKTRYQWARNPTGNLSICLLKLTPVTGRTHQLRVQCAKHGYPIVGDRTYGDFAYNKEIASETGLKRLMLHSAETTVRYAFKGQTRELTASAELPESFKSLLRHRKKKQIAPQKRVLAQQPKRPKPFKTSSVLKGRRFRRK